MRWVVFVALSLGLASGFTPRVSAQVVPGTTDPYYVAVIQQINGPFGPGYGVQTQAGIPLSYFATSSSVSSQINGIGNQLNGANSRINQAFQQIQQLQQSMAQGQQQMSQVYNGIAAAAALSAASMPSAPGRTTWAVNAAAFQSDIGAGFSMAYRLPVRTPMAVTVAYGNGGGVANVGRVGLMGEF